MTDGNGGKDCLMCGIALKDSGRILQLPVNPRGLMWWPFRVCECQSGGYSQSQLVRNLLDWACESQDKSAKNKEFIGANYNEAARICTKPGINHESTRCGMVFTN
jgi:hypothetical protein